MKGEHCRARHGPGDTRKRVDLLPEAKVPLPPHDGLSDAAQMPGTSSDATSGLTVDSDSPRVRDIKDGIVATVSTQGDGVAFDSTALVGQACGG